MLKIPYYGGYLFCSLTDATDDRWPIAPLRTLYVWSALALHYARSLCYRRPRDDVHTCEKEPKIILLNWNYPDKFMHASNNSRLVQQTVFWTLTQRMQRAFVWRDLRHTRDGVSELWKQSLHQLKVEHQEHCEINAVATAWFRLAPDTQWRCTFEETAVKFAQNARFKVILVERNRM